MIQYSKKPFQDYEQDPKKENDNGYLIHTMHHPDVDVGRSAGIFLPEEIPPYLSKGEELPETKWSTRHFLL